METTMIVALSALFALVGVFMFLTVAHPGWKEIGRLSFAFGLLSFLLQSAHIVNLLPK
jgi:hypothetical protein